MAKRPKTQRVKVGDRTIRVPVRTFAEKRAERIAEAAARTAESARLAALEKKRVVKPPAGKPLNAREKAEFDAAIARRVKAAPEQIAKRNAPGKLTGFATLECNVDQVAAHSAMVMAVLRDPALVTPESFGVVLHQVVDAIVDHIRKKAQ